MTDVIECVRRSTEKSRSRLLLFHIAENDFATTVKALSYGAIFLATCNAILHDLRVVNL